MGDKNFFVNGAETEEWLDGSCVIPLYPNMEVRKKWIEHFIYSSLNYYEGDSYRGFFVDGEWKKKISKKIFDQHGFLAEVIPGKANFKKEYDVSAVQTDFKRVSCVQDQII